MTDIPETPEEGVRQGVVEFANDMLVSTDLMNDLVGEVETYRVDEAVYLRHTLMTIAAKAKFAISALDAHLVDVMEFGDAVDYKGWTFRKGRKKERVRFDHEEIGKRVADAAYDRAAEAWGSDSEDYRTGAQRAAREAVAIMGDIYLSESTHAKVGQLDRYGIPRDPKRDDSVRTFIKGDPFIDVVPIQSEVQE
jgi:hypothetical protein